MSAPCVIILAAADVCLAQVSVLMDVVLAPVLSVRSLAWTRGQPPPGTPVTPGPARGHE